MKTIKKLVLVSLAATTMSNAWSDSAIETTQEINAQTTITRGAIDNLLEKINNRQIDTQFNALDYHSQVQAYKNKVEAALVKFEATIAKDVLAKASFWMDQYNAIYKSKDYSPEQKGMLLAQRSVNIKNQFAAISKDYQKAIKEVYTLIPWAEITPQFIATPAVGLYHPTRNSNENVRVDLVFNEKTKVSRTFAVKMKASSSNTLFKRYSADLSFEYASKIINTERGYYGYDWEEIKFDKSKTADNYYYTSMDFNEISKKTYSLHDDLISDFYKKIVYPSVKASCKSSICVSLRAADYSSLLVMIKKLIDRNMDVTLADGTKLTIFGSGKDNTVIAKMLSSVDYPEELPFDI